MTDITCFLLSFRDCDIHEERSGLISLRTPGPSPVADTGRAQPVCTKMKWTHICPGEGSNVLLKAESDEKMVPEKQK